jgi:hypothetical protein
MSNSVAPAHFGLAGAEIVDVLEVHWPSGKRQMLEMVPANQVLTVVEPTGT